MHPCWRVLNKKSSGSDGSCPAPHFRTARSGHDGPAGRGTPEGAGAFTGRPSVNMPPPPDVGTRGGSKGTDRGTPAAARSAW
ncbi:hypothetical protein ACJ6WE_20025 [Streptomyces sp. MMS24-I31]|uniref:hypothetical protein n=1 Tax=Streptomyces sp. MMS24-I31 TaxID=3351563 RepID=UPI003896D531